MREKKLESKCVLREINERGKELRDIFLLIEGGADSPPEPAPSDMRMNGGLRSLKPYGGELDPDSELSGYHHVQTGAGLYLPQGGCK